MSWNCPTRQYSSRRRRSGRSAQRRSPTTQRKTLGIKPGHRLRLNITKCELRVTSFKQAPQRVQKLARLYDTGKGLASEGLIHERRLVDGTY